MTYTPSVTNPTLPELIEQLFSGAGVQAPNIPRNDLVAVFQQFHCVGNVWFSPTPSCAVVQMPTNVRARTLVKTTG